MNNLFSPPAFLFFSVSIQTCFRRAFGPIKSSFLTIPNVARHVHTSHSIISYPFSSKARAYNPKSHSSPSRLLTLNSISLRCDPRSQGRIAQPSFSILSSLNLSRAIHRRKSSLEVSHEMYHSWSVLTLDRRPGFTLSSRTRRPGFTLSSRIDRGSLTTSVINWSRRVQEASSQR